MASSSGCGVDDRGTTISCEISSVIKRCMDKYFEIQELYLASLPLDTQDQVILSPMSYDRNLMLYHLLPDDLISRVVDFPIIDEQTTCFDSTISVGCPNQ